MLFLTSAIFAISSKSSFTGTNVRTKCILTDGVDVTNRNIDTAFVDV